MVAYCDPTIVSPAPTPRSNGRNPWPPTPIGTSTVLLYAAARLGVWLAVFAALFVPIERIFALHSQKIFRKEIAVDLGYYFLNGLLPGLVLGPPISAGCARDPSLHPGRRPRRDRRLADLAQGVRHDDGGRDRLLLGPSLEPPNSVPLAVSRRASQRRAARFSGQHPHASRGPGVVADGHADADLRSGARESCSALATA